MTHQGDLHVDLSWTAPSDTGGADIIDYAVEYCAGTLAYCTTGGGAWTTVHMNSTAPSGTVSLLTNGTLYQFRVRAENTVGLGDPSNIVPATPINPVTKPGIPQNLVIGASSSQMTLDWDPPADTGGSPIAHYHVQYSTWNTAGAGSCSGNWLPASPWESANSHFQTNQLDENQAYCFRVLAFNGVFESDWAVVSPTNPGAPTGLTVDPDSGHTHLSWSAPASDGGALITHYHVQYSRSTPPAQAAVRYLAAEHTAVLHQHVDTGEQPEHYHRVLLPGASGQRCGPEWMGDGLPHPAGDPHRPGRRKHGLGQPERDTDLDCRVPDGGAYTTYEVQYRRSGSSDWTTETATDPTVTLSLRSDRYHGYTYEFQVRAVNGVGSSAWSPTTPLSAQMPN